MARPQPRWTELGGATSVDESRPLENGEVLGDRLNRHGEGLRELLDRGLAEHGGWQVPFFDDDINTYAGEILFQSDALLLGRVTYESFAQAWPTITDDQGFADRMNSMPKYVASTTLTEPLKWNASLIRGDVAGEVAKMKRDHSLLVNGSGKLAQTLMRHGLIDDFRIWIHPVALGAGQRLFTDEIATLGMRLGERARNEQGVVLLSLAAALPTG